MINKPCPFCGGEVCKATGKWEKYYFHVLHDINCYLNDRKKSPVNYTLLPNNERYLTQWNNRQE